MDLGRGQGPVPEPDLANRPIVVLVAPTRTETDIRRFAVGIEECPRTRLGCNQRAIQIKSNPAGAGGVIVSHCDVVPDIS